MTIHGPVRSDLYTDASMIPSHQALIRDSGDVKELVMRLESITESLKLSRMACLDGMEAYFGGADPSTCIGPRNESAAISLLQQRLQSERDSTCGDHRYILGSVHG